MVENSKILDPTTLEILSAAASLFDRYGTRKTTMDDIAKEVGKGKSSLYYYFKNKEAVFESVLRRELAQFQSDIIRDLEAEVTQTDKIRVLISSIFEQAIHYPNLLRSFKGLIEGKSGRTANTVKEGAIAWELQQLNLLLEAGVSNGEFRAMGAEEVAINSQAISVAITGMKMILLGAPQEEIAISIRNLLNLLFNGIGKSK